MVWYGQVLENDLIKTFTEIRATKVVIMCQIIAISLGENKHYGQKPGVTVEHETGRTLQVKVAWPCILKCKM